MLSSESKEVPYGASPNIYQCYSHPCTNPTRHNIQIHRLIDMLHQLTLSPPITLKLYTLPYW